MNDVMEGFGGTFKSLLVKVTGFFFFSVTFFGLLTVALGFFAAVLLAGLVVDFVVDFVVVNLAGKATEGLY